MLPQRAWHGVLLPNTSIEPCSADEDQVAPPAVAATDFSVARSHNNQPAVSAEVVVTVNAVPTPVGIVDDAMSMVPSLPLLTIADTTADTATCIGRHGSLLEAVYYQYLWCG